MPKTNRCKNLIEIIQLQWNEMGFFQRLSSLSALASLIVFPLAFFPFFQKVESESPTKAVQSLKTQEMEEIDVAIIEDDLNEQWTAKYNFVEPLKLIKAICSKESHGLMDLAELPVHWAEKPNDGNIQGWFYAKISNGVPCVFKGGKVPAKWIITAYEVPVHCSADEGAFSSFKIEMPVFEDLRIDEQLEDESSPSFEEKLLAYIPNLRRLFGWGDPAEMIFAYYNQSAVIWLSEVSNGASAPPSYKIVIDTYRTARLPLDIYSYTIGNGPLENREGFIDLEKVLEVMPLTDYEYLFRINGNIYFSRIKPDLTSIPVSVHQLSSLPDGVTRLDWVKEGNIWKNWGSVHDPSAPEECISPTRWLYHWWGIIE